MLAKILKMPPAMGVPINRQLSVSLNDLDAMTDIRWSQFPTGRQRFSVGFPIRTLAGKMFKAIYLPASGGVYEAVFSEQNGQYLCWYVKIITAWDTVIGVSLNAIKFLTGGNYPICPTSYFFWPPLVKTGIDYVLPVILTERDLWSFGQRALLDTADDRGKPMSHMYRPILLDEPQLLQALIEGWYSHNPFGDVTGYCPQVQIHQDPWFGFQETFYGASVKGMACQINHRAFDPLVARCINFRQSRFSVTALLSTTLDVPGSRAYTIRDFYDPYWMVLSHQMFDQRFQQDLDGVFREAVLTYCRLFKIDPDWFHEDSNGSKDTSSLTISKTSSDEVCFTFHDNYHNRQVCFYSFFPLLAMSTLAAATPVP